MLDKTLVSIIAMVFGGVGLIGAITRFDIPKSERTVFGENLFLQKENIINNVITWVFTIYAMIGLILQILLGEIIQLEERLHSTGFYFSALSIALIVIISLVPLMKRLSKWIARDYWVPELVKKARENYLLAKSLIETKNEVEKESNPQALKIVGWLEDLFEMKSEKPDLISRLKYFEKLFEEK